MIIIKINGKKKKIPTFKELTVRQYVELQNYHKDKEYLNSKSEKDLLTHLKKMNALFS